MQNEASQVLGMEDLNSPVMGGQNAINAAESPAMSGPEKPKDKPKDKEAEEELFNTMFFSPSSGDADTTVTLDTTTDESEAEKEAREDMKKKGSNDLLKILEKGDSKLSKKYQKELLDKALKDPASVEVNTPNGWMTVRDAIDAGFDMVTGKFDKEPIPPVDWEGEISKLDPREQETIRRLTQRGTGQAGPRPQPMSGEASLEEAGVNPRPDVPVGEPPASDAGMTMGSAPEIPLGM